MTPEERKKKLQDIRDYTLEPNIYNANTHFLLSEIDRRDEALRDIRDNYDCECVVGTRTAGAHHCQSCVAREALGEE